jgi:hypothetical protein
MFGENRFHLSVGRELAALPLGLSLRQVSLFLRRQREDRLFVTGIGQQHAGCLILHFEWKGLNLLHGPFEQFSHVESIRFSAKGRKQNRLLFRPYNLRRASG